MSSIDGRARVDLYNSNTSRTTVAYSRYLMAVKIGRYLTDEEEVDHIDTNCSNDSIDNLQILSLEDHRKKNSRELTTGRSIISLVCSYCDSEFTREVRNVNPSRDNYFCSRRCNGKFYWGRGVNRKNDEA